MYTLIIDAYSTAVVFHCVYIITENYMYVFGLSAGTWSQLVPCALETI